MACASITTAPSTELATIEQLKEAWLRNECIAFGDPTLARVELPLEQTYSPLGFPVLLKTNSEEVLAAAFDSWNAFLTLFETPVVEVSVMVTDGGSDQRPGPPVCKIRDHLVTNIADPDNFAVVDLARGTAFVSVTHATVRDREYFRYFFLESSAMALIANKYATGIHAACVEWNGAAVLLCGDSGSGKSTLAYACARSGWTYVTDDGSYLVLGEKSPLVVGNCSQVRFRPDAPRFFAELQGSRPMSRAGIGKPTLELPVRGAAAIRTSPIAQARHLVFLKRGYAEPSLNAFPAEVARMYLAQQVCCMPYAQDKHLRNIDRLLELGVHELRYDRLDWAVERLKTLAGEGR